MDVGQYRNKRVKLMVAMPDGKSWIYHARVTSTDDDSITFIEREGRTVTVPVSRIVSISTEEGEQDG